MSKQFTPAEVAVMVLKKAEELYKASPLAKGDWNKIHNKLEKEGYSKEEADKIDGSIKAKVEGKKEVKKDEMGDAPAMEMSEEAPMKGHIKLAKFCGRMEHKRGQKEMDKSAEDPSKMSGKTGMVRGTTESNLNQTGVNQLGNKGSSGGISEAGSKIRDAAHSSPKQAAGAIAGAKDIHKETLNQIHQMTKPKLPG